jgi:hypothetical protein
MGEQGIPVVQTKTNGQIPKASVFAGAGKRPLTPAELKRLRFIFNLKQSYRRLKETLSAVEHFAAINGLSAGTVLAVKTAHENALKELSLKFKEKLDAYDSRIGRIP